MFTPDEILTLCKAGFTAQQVAGLSMLMNTAPAPAPEPTPAPAPEPAPALAPVPAPAPAQEQKDPVLLELEKLTGLMQMQNIQGGQIPPKKTADEIMAEIINPPIIKKE